MIVELLSVLVMSAAARTVEPEPLAKLDHFSTQPGQSWALSLTETAARPSARLWWIEGMPAHRGFPERLLLEAGLQDAELPDGITARTADLDAAQCSSLAEIARELEAALAAPLPAASFERDRSRPRFELEVRGRQPIDLNDLAVDHPLVRWADHAWRALSACAAAR